jgi:hypothetical protein
VNEGVSPQRRDGCGLVVVQCAAQFLFAQSVTLDNGLLEVTGLRVHITEKSLALLRLAHSMCDDKTDGDADNEPKYVLHGYSRKDDKDNVFKYRV